MQNRTFLFQVNVTRDCNLRCTHCYISSDKKAQSQFMSEEQFIEVFVQIKEFLKQDAEGRAEYSMADIHVIGGEPTMLGYKFFEKTMPRVRELMSEVKQTVKLSIVTNLLTGKSVEIAKMFDNIATSYEHETRFVSKSGKPKPQLETKWLENVAEIYSSERECSVTMAVTKQAVDFGASKILDFFYENKFKSIHLGFFIPSGDGLVYIDSVFPMFEETTAFMIEATNWYLERRLDDRNLYVNPIESMIESIYRKTPIDDIVCPIIPGSLDIDWNGDTVTCIEAGGEVDMDSLGNIYQIPIKDILKTPKYIRERARAIMPKPHCLGCDEIEACQSACGVLHGYWNGQGECPGFKGFIKHIRHLVENEGLLPKSEIYKKPFSHSAGC